jgi:hypothetical protein
VSKRIGSYPCVRIEGGGRAVVSRAGGVLLVETVRKSGLDIAISAALAPWRRPRAVHDPGKILLDVALAVALGGDCLADVAMLRAEPAVFGPVAFDPTVSWLIDKLAAGGPKALTAIRAARAEVRERVWKLAGTSSPDAGGSVIVDLDGVLVLAHSDKQDAAATWKKTYGHHPLMGFVDHGHGGTGEPVAALLRPGNAGSNTAADHITATQPALVQLPKRHRRGRSTLIRTDSAGGTHEFVAWLAKRGRRLSYPVGMTITDAIHQAVLKVPASAWAPAVEPGGEIRRTAAHRICHQHHRRPDRRPGTAAPPTRTSRGPHPGRPRHRPAQPASPRHRTEPDLAGDRPARPRPAGLAAAARPDRQTPPLGAPPPAAATVLRRRPARHHRPPPAPEIHPPLALDGCDHQRDPATRRTPEPWLTSSNDPSRRTGTTHRNRGTRRTPDATAGPPACPSPTRQTETDRPRTRRPATKDRG